jgi:hypothetical protein
LITGVVIVFAGHKPVLERDLGTDSVVTPSISVEVASGVSSDALDVDFEDPESGSE